MQKLFRKIFKSHYCPICCEDLGEEPFCSSHGDVSGLQHYKYHFPVAQISSLYYKVFGGF